MHNNNYISQGLKPMTVSGFESMVWLYYCFVKTIILKNEMFF